MSNKTFVERKKVVIEQEVSNPQMAVMQSTSAINLFLGGVGSGKTHLLGMKTFYFIRKFPKVRGFIAANTYLQLEHSTLFRIREYWKSIGVVEYDKDSRPWGQYIVNKRPPSSWDTSGHNFDSYYGIISFYNGCVIFIGSLDNAKAHEGKEFGWAVLDETKDTKEEDVKEIIIARIRQRGIYLVDGVLKNSGTQEQQYNPLYIATSPAKVDWINDWFSLEDHMEEITSRIYRPNDFFQAVIGDKFAVISSTYHNVQNVGLNYINKVLSENSDERGKALIFANPFTLTGGEFYSSFDRLRHVGEVRYNPSIPIHISFDQNAVPYNSASIWQVWRDKDYYILGCIDEIALTNPRNSTEEVCDEFIYRYKDHNAGLFFYGDASGRNRSTMSKDFRHHYDIVEYKLKKYLINISDRTLRSNPSVVKRRDFVNRLFEDKLPVRVIIDESCRLMIADLMYCKQAIDGGKDKHIVTDKGTGEKYQKYGHMGDCFTFWTKVITDRGDKNIGEITVGDRVLTRSGFRGVTKIWDKGIRTVNTYKIGRKSIECTDDHKIFTDRGFRTVAELTDMNIYTIFARKVSWTERLLSLMGISFTDIPVQREYQTSVISEDGSGVTCHGVRYQHIGMYGRKLTGKLQKATLSIMSMAISRITELRTFASSVIQSICDYITISPLRNIRIAIHANSLNARYLRQSNGTSQPRAESGITSIQQDLFTQTNTFRSVSVAVGSSDQTCAGGLSGVRENVNSNIRHARTEQRKDITQREPVRHAERFSRLINGVRLSSVLVHVSRDGQDRQERVFDITVEQDHEFFANGILVHNCFEYLTVELFSNFYSD